MALIRNCAKCGAEFWTSISDWRDLCSKCVGTDDALLAEELRWNTLSLEEKVEELHKKLKETNDTLYYNKILG